MTYLILGLILLGLFAWNIVASAVAKKAYDEQAKAVAECEKWKDEARQWRTEVDRWRGAKEKTQTSRRVS